MKHITALIAIVSVLIGPAALPVRADIPEGETQFFTPVPTRRAENIEQVTSLGGLPGAIAVRGNYAYVVAGQNLEILDVSDPARPGHLNRIPLSRWPFQLKFVADFLYAATSDGLLVIDLSNPLAPQVAGLHPELRIFLSGSKVSGPFLYNLADINGLQVIDVSDPIHPVEVAIYPAGENKRINNLDIAGKFAFVAVNGRGLQILDISDPSDPPEVGFYSFDRSVDDIVVRGGPIYLVASNGELVVLKSDFQADAQ